MDFVRKVVSKKKKRYTDNGFDLDLSYVTPSLVAMGFPSEGVEGLYRNPIGEVKRFFKTRHDGHYKIYNLCSERGYDLETKFDVKCERFGFPDHNPPPFEMIKPFCENMDEYLGKHDDNVASIHCKAGKVGPIELHFWNLVSDRVAQEP